MVRRVIILVLALMVMVPSQVAAEGDQTERINAQLQQVLVDASPSSARQTDQGWEFHGFAFWISRTSMPGSPTPAHLWLIGKGPVCDQLEALVILAPYRPTTLKFIQNLQVTWKEPMPGVDGIALGRMPPPFGRELAGYRVDQVPTVLFSAINQPLVIRDEGIKIWGHEDRLKWAVGGFLGDRTGGNVPLSRAGDWDGYVRLVYLIDEGLEVGASQRIGPVTATGLDLNWQEGNLQLTAEGSTPRGKRRLTSWGSTG